MATAGRLYTGGKGRVGVYEATYIMAAHVHTIRTTKPNGTTFFFRSFFIFPARPGDDTGWDVTRASRVATKPYTTIFRVHTLTLVIGVRSINYVITIAGASQLTYEGKGRNVS